MYTSRFVGFSSAGEVKSGSSWRGVPGAERMGVLLLYVTKIYFTRFLWSSFSEVFVLTIYGSEPGLSVGCQLLLINVPPQ